MQIRVGIVEDDFFICENLKTLINESDGYICNHSFNTAERAIKEIPELNLNVVLMDINLPGKNGIECVNELKSKCKEVQFLMCTAFDDKETILSSIRAGAKGFISKTAKSTEIIKAIDEIYHGGSPLSRDVSRKLIDSIQAKNNTTKYFYLLSEREQEVIQLLAKGLRYIEIAKHLFLSVETVRTHVRNIYEKLNVHSRTAALNKIFIK